MHIRILRLLFFPLSLDAATLPEIVVKAPPLLAENSLNSLVFEKIPSRPETLKDSLKSISGIDTAGYGGLGQRASIYIRGNEPYNTYVIKDGLLLNDPSTPDSAFNGGNYILPLGMALKLEKGTESHSIGGNLRFTTPKGEGKPKTTLTTIAGSHGLHNEQAQFQGQKNKISYNFSFNHLHTQGTNTVPQSIRKFSRDYLTDKTDLIHINGRVDGKIFDNLKITYIGSANGNRHFYNDRDFLNTFGDNRFKKGLDRQLTHIFKTLYKQNVSNGSTLIHTVTGGMLLTRRKDRGVFFELSPAYSRQGQRKTMTYRGHLRLKELGGIITELTHRLDQMKTYLQSFNKELDKDKRTSRTSVLVKPYVMKTIQKNRIYADVWMERDHNSTFKDSSTYGSSIKHTLPSQIFYRLGFHHAITFPSLFQLYGRGSTFINNASLKPESGNVYDMTVGQKLGHFHVEGSFFQHQIKNIIVPTRANGLSTYENKGKSWIKGIELQGVYFGENVWIKTSYLYLATHNRLTQQALLRRPQQRFSFSCAYNNETFELGQETLYRGRFYDYDEKTFNVGKGKPFSITSLFLNIKCHKSFKAFAKIDNIFNKHYQEILWYEQGGRTFLVGGSYTF